MLAALVAVEIDLNFAVDYIDYWAVDSVVEKHGDYTVVVEVVID